MKERVWRSNEKMSERKTKVQTGTGGEGERVMTEDGQFGSGRREKYGEKSRRDAWQ